MAVDGQNRLHLAVAGAPGDYNDFWSSLEYLASSDGLTWTPTVLDRGYDDGHANRRPSIALDSSGRPAISPQIRTGTCAAWHVSTTRLRKRRIAGLSQS